MKWILRSCLVALCLSSQVALAELYHWKKINFETTSQHSTALAACVSYGNINYGGRLAEYSHMEAVSAEKYLCYYYIWYKDSPKPSEPSATYGGSELGVRRWGTECPPDTTYNPETTACEGAPVNQCEVLAGETVGNYRVSTVLNGDPPSTIDIGGCEATFAGVIICRNTTNGTGVCTGTATITGVETPSATGPIAGEGAECSGPDCLQGAPETMYETIPCEYTTDANGYKVCSSSDVYSKPGTTQCDQAADGRWTCTESPKSVSSEKVVDTTIAETASPDGSSSSTRTDTTTTTKCEGLNNCETKTGQETTTGGTQADGSQLPESTTCTGETCEQEKEGESVASGGSCDAALFCSGDAIQCEILKQEKAQRCAFDEAMDWEGNKQQVLDEVQGEKYQLQEEVIEAPSLLASGTRFLSPSCPAPLKASLLGGQAIEMDLSPFCTFAEGLAPIVVACALLFAALYVGRGMGS